MELESIADELEKVILVVAKIVLQKKPPRPKSIQISPMSHGSGVQGSKSNSHNVPDTPRGHTHRNSPTGWRLQVPLLKHGFGSHGSVSTVQLMPAYPWSQLHVYVLLPSMQEMVLF